MNDEEPPPPSSSPLLFGFDNSLSYSRSEPDMAGPTHRGEKESDLKFPVATVRGDGYGGNVAGGHNAYHSNANGNASGTAISRPTPPLQSHNYEPDESEIWRAHQSMLHLRNRGAWWTPSKSRNMKQWALTFVIGVVQAVVASRCNTWSRGLSGRKFAHVGLLLEEWRRRRRGMADADRLDLNLNFNFDLNYNYDFNRDSFHDFNHDFDLDYHADDGIAANFNSNFKSNFNSDSNSNASLANDHPNSSHRFHFLRSPFLVYLLYQTLFALIASAFSYVEPVSAGSGIPEIKVYLNGVDVPRIMRAKTLACRALGCVFSVASGFPVGMEGPMIHSGAVVAALVSQGDCSAGCLRRLRRHRIRDFRNDGDKRDFVSCGAAAGVASAFASPLGGVLFSLEEGASYWSTRLTWRAFFCAMVTLATLYGIRNRESMWGQTDVDKLFSLGEFTAIGDGSSNYSIWELAVFAVLGCIGGLIGACFNAASEHMTLWRIKRVNHSKTRRVVEVLLLSVLTSCVSFLVPHLWDRCTDLPTDVQGWNNQQKELMSQLVPFQCVPGKEYNEVASLYLVDADVAIRQLFHFRETGLTDAPTFSSAAIFLFFVPYITLACIVYGIGVPSGLLVPSLLSGASFGRLFGHLLHMLDHTSGTFADSGTYSLMGAAAIMAGFSRMTISVTVILLEATGNMQYVLPLMITVMAARFTGNLFNEGIYDATIHIKKYPLLEQEVPGVAERHEIVAGQAMTSAVKCLRPVERVGVVYDLLRYTSHGNFPIVDTASSSVLYGTTSRSMLCTLLHRRAFCHHKDGYSSDPFLESKRLLPLVQWETIESQYPDYPTIESIELQPGDRRRWIDLRPYANTAPYTVNETASIQRTYRLFRTLGLRFLCVVNHHNQLVGIITRKDLLPHSLWETVMRGRNAHLG